MARRYGKLPTEVLDLTVEDFTLNTIIFSMGMKFEASVKRGRPLVLSGSADDLPSKMDAIFGRIAGRKKSRKRSKGK